MKAGKKEGKSPKMIEFERAQRLTADGIKNEWQLIKTATSTVSESASEVVLGIMADTGTKGIDSLKAWVTGLQLTKGMLRGYDDSGAEVSVEQLNSVPVYIKYNSSNAGDAYMKPFGGNYTGVIFQPKIQSMEASTDEFMQFGNFPLSVYKLQKA